MQGGTQADCRAQSANDRGNSIQQLGRAERIGGEGRKKMYKDTKGNGKKNGC